jgi:hypothetical protein
MAQSDHNKWCIQSTFFTRCNNMSNKNATAWKATQSKQESKQTCIQTASAYICKCFYLIESRPCVVARCCYLLIKCWWREVFSSKKKKKIKKLILLFKAETEFSVKTKIKEMEDGRATASTWNKRSGENIVEFNLFCRTQIYSKCVSLSFLLGFCISVYSILSLTFSLQVQLSFF